MRETLGTFVRRAKAPPPSVQGRVGPGPRRVRDHHRDRLARRRRRARLPERQDQHALQQEPATVSTTSPSPRVGRLASAATAGTRDGQHHLRRRLQRRRHADSEPDRIFRRDVLHVHLGTEYRQLRELRRRRLRPVRGEHESDHQRAGIGALVGDPYQVTVVGHNAGGDSAPASDCVTVRCLARRAGARLDYTRVREGTLTRTRGRQPA